MKKKLVLLLGVALIFSSVCAATIGSIEVERVFNGYKETAKTQKVLLKKKKAYSKTLAEKKQELEEAKIDGKSPKEMEKLSNKVEKELKPMKDDLEQLIQTNMLSIRKDIVTATEGVAKELGVDVVVDKQVLIVGGIDLTDLVIEKLNKKK